MSVTDLPKKESQGNDRQALEIHEAKAALIAILLRKGQAPLAQAVGISEGEISKKIYNESGWKLEQLVRALDFVDVRIIAADDVVLSQQEYAALKILARKALK